MTVLQTSSLTIPEQILDPWLGKIQGGSTIATLSGQTPMKFGTGTVMSFDIGEAEYVGEHANKGASSPAVTTKVVTPYKFHKTIRWTNEVMWADEDHQMQVVTQLLDQIAPSLARALDYGVFHGINPTSGATVAAMTSAGKLSDTTNSVEITTATLAKPYLDVDAADALVLADNYVPRDIALDPAFASVFAGVRGTSTPTKVYPDLSLATAPAGQLENHRSSVSKTVGAVGVAASATNVRAFVGDFSAIRWGVQKEIGIKLIEYGDPDGQGDLQRTNEVAFRAEVVYGWAIADLNAFAKIIDAVANT